MNEEKLREMEKAGKSLLNSLTSLNSLKTQESLERLEIDLTRYTKFLPHSITGNNKPEVVNAEDIDDLLYSKIITTLLQTLDDNFQIFKERLNIQIENLMIVRGSNCLMLYELLTSVTEFLKYTQREESVEFIISILERLLKSEALTSSIISACKKVFPPETDFQSEEYGKSFKNFCQILVSLPVKVSNRVKRKIPETFSLNNFSKIVSYQIIQAIFNLNEEFTNEKTVFDVKPLSLLISKLLVSLGSENFEELVKIFICWSLENKNGLKTVIQDIFLNIPSASIAPITILLLENLESPKDVIEIFENLMKNENWRRTITTKIVLFSYFKNDKLIINLVNCLLCDSERSFVQLIIKIFDVWGDKSALNHTNLEQHEYLTKILLLSMNKLKGRLKPLERQSIQELLFSGTGAHLEDMQVEIRGIGMIAGELILNCLNDSDAPKLKYDYESMPQAGAKMVEKLKEFWAEKCEKLETNSSSDNLITSEIVIQELGTKSGILRNKQSLNPNSKIPAKVLKFIEKTIEKESLKNSDEDLDSDDDLTPYDMSNDQETSKNRVPIYLRDLRDNLVNSSENADPNIFSESLKSSEKLITTQLANDDSSFAVELLSIFSKLSEISYVENFNYLKFKSCVAITKIHPKESAEYLCREFHAKIGSHSVNDRLLFLNILAEAARELSKFEVKNEEESIKTEDSPKKSVSAPISLFLNLDIGKKMETLYDDDFEISNDFNSEDEISTRKKENLISERIKLNTRIFAHPSKRSPTTENRFNGVAAHFFYPLLHGMRKTDGNIFHAPKNFEDQGNILLINFVKTLSAIMVAAENCVIAPKIGKDLLELAWNLRFHEQSVVRCCVMESIAAVIVAVSRENLTGEIFDLLLELRIWLEDVGQESVNGDPSVQCRAMARNVASLIESMFPVVQ